MKKPLNVLRTFVLTSITTLNLISCSKSDLYYDDRTDIQLQDNNFLLKNKLTLNRNKHVLILGIDGLEYEKIPKNIIDKSFFKTNFRTQSYETFKGWKSIIWGNILELGKNVFQLIKDNNYDFKNATYLQNLGQYWTKDIFNNSIQKSIDDYNEINDLDSKKLNNVEKYMSELYYNSFKLINSNYNFSFVYNGFYDDLKHQRFENNSSQIINLFIGYNNLWKHLIDELDANNWLILATTDHGRNSNGYDHSNESVSSHASWVLANQDLYPILKHGFSNLYDIRTVVLKWLMT